MLFSALISVLAVIQLAGATALGAVRLDTSSLKRELVERQSDVPTQCQAGCDPVNTLIKNGCSPAQCCTSSFENQYFDCFVCVENALSISNYTAVQQTIDDFLTACAVRGFSIPKLTFPGQDANRPLSTLASSAASTAASTAISASSSMSRTTVTTGLTTTTSQTVVTSLTSTPGTTSRGFTQQTVTSLSTTASVPSTSSTAPAASGARLEGTVLSIPVLIITLAMGWILI